MSSRLRLGLPNGLFPVGLPYISNRVVISLSGSDVHGPIGHWILSQLANVKEKQMTIKMRQTNKKLIEKINVSQKMEVDRLGLESTA